jgi:NAD(P)-dependent dehydrogenase (short-subunit alcohol dehydrogenase family)
VLIHGAAGGVGGFAVQLARVHGAQVIGTVSTANVARARALGADEVIDHTRTRVEDAIAPVDLASIRPAGKSCGTPPRSSGLVAGLSRSRRSRRQSSVKNEGLAPRTLWSSPTASS